MVELRIQFKKANDYKIIAATGAWGGVSPQGEIFFDFFVEKKEPPSSIRIKVEPGLPPEEISREEEVLVREAQIGVIIRPDIAHAIGKWLLEKAREAGFTERSEGNA